MMSMARSQQPMVTQGLVTRAHAPLEVAAKRRARMRRFMYLLQVLVAQPRRMENIQTARGRSANAQTVRIAAEAPGKIIPGLGGSRGAHLGAPPL